MEHYIFDHGRHTVFNIVDFVGFIAEKSRINNGKQTVKNVHNFGFIRLVVQIALRARAIAELTGIEVVMTRDSPDIAYPDNATTIAERKKADQHQRAELIRKTDNAVLISIHQNCYPDRKPSGAQVLYAASDGSEALGTQIHDNLVAYLDPQNRRVAAPISEKIYLMREVKCPAVLVECGFLSNESECTKLKDGGYQTKLAAVIIASYLQYRQSLPQTGMVT